MTHDELFKKIENQTIHIANKIKPVADDCEKEIGGFANALRAVVELHMPQEITLPNGEWDMQCLICRGYDFPCTTIREIERALK